MKKLYISLLLLLSLPFAVHADIFGDGNIGTLEQFTSTTTPLSSITQRIWGKAIKVTGLSDGCLNLTSSILTSTGVACGAGGGGSSGGTWSTTTSQVSGNLINYPNNVTDVVTIGSNATTSGEYWFDPNASKAHLFGSTLFGLATTTKQSVGGGGPETIGIMRTNANDLDIWSGVTGDIQGRWLVEANGLMGWGPGGTTDQDINFYRSGAGALTVQSGTTNSTDAFRVNQFSGGTGTAVLTVNTVSAYVSVPWLLVNGAGGGAKMDVYGGGTTAIRAEQTSIADVAFSSFVTGDAQLRFSFLADGTQKWGSGTSVADTNLYRNAIQSLKTDTSLVVGGTLTVATTTATSTISGGGFDLRNTVVQEHVYPSFTYATSTAWTGTTTIPLGISYGLETWNGVKCFTDAGTLNVSFYDGTNRMNMFNASTTVGTVGLITNNQFTVSEKRYVDIGTPATSPTKISCTVDKTINI